MPEGAIDWLIETASGWHTGQARRSLAAVIAAALVVVLALFFQQTAHRPRAARRGRRPPGRAVGRHPAAADLGHRVGGGGLRRAGGGHDLGRASSACSSRLSLIALKALPVLILGGFDLDARRHRRRADHRRRREARRGLPRARCVGGGDRELVRLRAGARCSCWCGRRACSAKRSSSGSEARIDTMLYREAGQFKTSYAADQADLSDPPGPHRWCSLLVRRVRRGAASSPTDYCCQRHPDPVPDLVAGGHRAQHPDRLLRPDLARHRRLHGGGRLSPPTTSCCRIPGMPCSSVLLASAAASPRPGRHACSACRACASRASTWRWRRSPRSSSSHWAVHRSSAGSPNYSDLGRRCRAREIASRSSASPIDYAGGRSTCSTSSIVVVLALAGQEPRARRDRPLVDGDPRHGRRRRGDRHPAAADQARGLRGQLLLHRRGRRAAVRSSTSAPSEPAASTSTARSSCCS